MSSRHSEDNPDESRESDDSNELLGLERDDLEKAALLYENIRAQRRQKDKKVDKKLADDFVKFLEDKMMKLSTVIMNQNIPKHIKSGHILDLRFETFGFCFGKMNEQMRVDQPALGKIYTVVFNNIKDIYEDAVGLIQILRSNEEVKGLQEHIVEKEEEIEDLQEKMTQTIEAAEKIESECDEVRKELEGVRNERDRITKQVEKLIEQNDRQRSEIDHLNQRIQKLSTEINSEQMDNYKQENDELRRENEHIMKIMIKRCKRDVLNQTKESSYSPDAMKPSPQKAVLLSPKDESKDSPRKQSLFGNPAAHTAPLGKTRDKILTLHQLKELIREIYHSKQKYDEQCRQHKAPIETMEQYLYTYLNNKYGLKTLIIEWTVGIINAIKMFKDEDHDVYLFAKILKNCCEEDFVESQQQVRDTINAIMKLWAREKYVYKPDHQIDLMMPELKNANYSLDFYLKVLEKLYPEERDRVYVEMHLEDHIHKKKPRIANNTTFGNSSIGQLNISKKAIAREEISFNIFEKIVLDYQLNEHCKFLDKFTELFGQIDSDTNGIITRGQFLNLLFQMDIIYEETAYTQDHLVNEEAKYLISVVDPHETDQIIFSEIVKLFTSHPAKLEGPGSEIGIDQISVLEKFVTKALELEESQKRIMIKLHERIIEESKNEDQPDDYERMKQDFQADSHNYENQAYDELKEEYENYKSYERDMQKSSEAEDEHNLSAEIENKGKEPGHNYLAHSLDPVEEDDKEEQSQRSNRNSILKKQSVLDTDKDYEESQNYDSKEGEEMEDE